MRAWRIVGLGLVAWLAASCGISGDAAGPQDQQKTDLEIRDVLVTPTDTSAVIHWATTGQTVGTLSYGRSQNSLQSALSSTLSADHTVTLTNLSPDTQYWYRITAASTTGARAATQPVSFRTLPSSDLGDTTAPVISDIQVVGITSSSATVTWKTDDRTFGATYYGLDALYGASVVEADPNVFTTAHALSLSNLTEATIYHFRIGATNRAGLHAFSLDQTFTTASLPVLSISPDSVRVSGNGDFVFHVSIENVANLAGISFKLAYDPQMVEIRSVAEGDFWWDHDGFIPLMLESQDATLGRAEYAASWKITFLNTSAVGTRASGGGDVAIISARAKGDGVSSLLRLIVTDENGDGNPDTRLLDYNRVPMKFHTRDGCIIKQVQ